MGLVYDSVVLVPSGAKHTSAAAVAGVMTGTGLTVTLMLLLVGLQH